MSNDWPLHNRDERRDYLTDLLTELREKIAKLEQQRVRMVSAPVTAIDTVGSTFSVTLPAQEDGTTLAVSGIASPPAFLPAVSDNVDLQIIGAIPQYQPGTIAQDVVTTREIAPLTVTRVFRQPGQPTADNVGDVWIDTDDGNKEYIWGPTGAITRQNLALNPSFEADTAGTVTAISSWTGYRVVTDGATTISNATVTSATAAFVTGDIGATITGTNIPAGTVINSITNGTTVVLSHTSTATGSSLTFTIGSVAPLTQSISTTGSLVANGTRAAKVVKASMAATNNTGFGWSQTYVAVPGDLFRFQAVVTVLVADANKIPELLVEWLNSTGGVIGSGTTAGSGSTSSQQTLVYASAAMPALTTNIRLTIRRRANGTGSALVNGDLAADAVLVEKNSVAQTQTTYFDGNTPNTTDSKWDTPSLAPNTTSTYWQDSVAGANQWWPMQLRNGGIQSGSIVGSNALAAQTITASLLEALMVLTNIVIAGDPAGAHATMQSDGFHIFRTITGEGVLETGKLSSSSSSDFLTLSNSAGTQLFNIDDLGGVSAQDLEVANDPTIGGAPLSGLLSRSMNGGGAGTPAPGATNWYGWANGGTSAIGAVDTGMIEMSTYLDSTRIYWLVAQVLYSRSAGSTYLQLRVRDGGASTPNVTTSPIVTEDYYQNTDVSVGGRTCSATHHRLWNPSTTGTHRLLLCVSGQGGGTITVNNVIPPTLTVVDLGPYKGQNATTNAGGGGTPVPTQQYYVELSPAGWGTYNGSGGLRGDTTDVVQGWDPSGFNGLGTGLWWFTIPSITGTVNWVQWAVYTNQTYYNSGATAVWNIVSSGAGWSGGNITNKQGSGGDQFIGGYPKPGWKNWDMPSSWWPQFKNSPPSGLQAVGVSAGNSGLGTNEAYYARFDGPSARLRIWYTQ